MWQDRPVSDIEAALADSFDAEHLAVYADHLQSHGDPRGELIALDLEGISDGRDELIARWLGDDVATLLERSSIEVGFITDLLVDDASPPELLDAVLASPAGACVRGVTIQGVAPTVRTAIARLVAHRHPWLDRLSVQANTANTRTVVPDDIPLATAMPALRELEVWGRRVFGELAHPGVRTLRVTGYEAIGAILEDGPRGLPNVAVLDLACDARGATAEDVAEAVRDRLPALRRLDLSRNEPGRMPPHYLGGAVDACELLARLSVRARLSHVRLPSVRSREQAHRLAGAIASMPALRQLGAARSYHAHRHVAVPPELQLPDAYPWWPADTLQGEMVHFRRWGGAQEIALPFGALVIALESVELSESQLTTWCKAIPGHPVPGPARCGELLDALVPLEAIGDLARLADLRRFLALHNTERVELV
jgi:hypothetical protein